MWGRRRARTCAACLVVVGVAAATSGEGAQARAATMTAVPNRCPGQVLTCAQLVELGLTYPYRREPGSYLFVGGRAVPYVALTSDLLGNSLVSAHGQTMTAAALLQALRVAPPAGPLTPVLAYGANANVDALRRKYLSPGARFTAVVPVIKGRLPDYDVTWTPQLVSNGAMPATLTPSPGTEVSAWTTWLGIDELRRMNATEGVGTLYSAGRLRGAALRAPGPSVGDPLVYVDCRGPLRVRGRTLAIAAVPAAHRRFAGVSSAEALRRVEPALGWRGTAAALIRDNVRHPARRRARDRALAALATSVSNPHYRPSIPCRTGRHRPA